MKYILLFLLILFPTEAFGDIIPQGCFVANADPSTCWVSNPADSWMGWYQYPDANQEGVLYGSAVAFIIEEDIKDTNTAVAETLIAEHQAKIIKRLISLCGRKCRGIR